MPWVRVDEKFSRGRKVKRASRVLGGKNARGRVLAVWVDAMSYCALHLTDGFYPDDEMDFLPDGKPEDVFRAMALGDDDIGAMVERDETRGGWVFRNYAEYQPTKAEVEARLAKDRDRKRGGIHKESARIPRGKNSDSERTGPIGLTRPTDPEDQEPREVAPRSPSQLRMELRSLVEVRRHLRAACHRLIETEPDCQPSHRYQLSNLAERLKRIAARDLNVDGYGGDGIQKIITAVVGARARRSA